MNFEFQPNYEQIRQRIEAFWNRDFLDRPVVMLKAMKPFEQQIPEPVSHHSDTEARWMDAQYQADLALAHLANTIFLGDALPIAYPNLGPEVFSGFYGCKLHFSDFGTSWSDPCLEDWTRVDELRLDWDSVYMKKLVEMTDVLLDVGRDKFIVGMPDWHPGGDAIAAFRDPQELAIDMIQHKAEVMQLLKRIEVDYFAVYDFFYQKLKSANQPITSWLPLVSDDKYYIPSNDFSIMVSKKMYDEVFLPGIINECRFLNRSIYHLDGPGALRHLDSILAINDLDALQWVAGDGNWQFTRWIGVYQQAQAAGKGIAVYCQVHELNDVMKYLDPRGLYIELQEWVDVETGENILKEIERWAKKR